MTTHEAPRSFRGHGRNAIYLLFAPVVGGIAILWSWNTVAVDLFSQPRMEFRHAIAVVFLIVALGALFALPAALARVGRSEI